MPKGNIYSVKLLSYQNIWKHRDATKLNESKSQMFKWAENMMWLSNKKQQWPAARESKSSRKEMQQLMEKVASNKEVLFSNFSSIENKKKKDISN